MSDLSMCRRACHFRKPSENLIINKYFSRPRVVANYSRYQTETSLAGLKITSTVPDLPASKDTEWFV